MSSGIADLVEQLALLTESHVLAATSLDAARVGQLAHERADRMFELKIRLQGHPHLDEPLDEPERVRTRAATERLARAEHRLQRALHSLLNVLQPPSDGPTLYGRAGQILEVSRGHA